MRTRLELFTTVFERELRSVARSRIFYALAGGFTLLVFGLAFATGISAYVPLVLTLLTPLEIVVPVLAAAFGYRAVLGDREREELTILRTFPVTRGAYVGGVYAGRLVALTVTIGAPLVLLWAAIPLFGRADTFLFQTAGLDSPVLYFRFVVLTLVFGAALLSGMVLISSLVRTSRRALVSVIGLGFVTVLGVDLVVIFGATGGAATAAVPGLAVAGPNGAFRGLVMALVVEPVLTTPTATAPLWASAGSLVLWLVVPLGLSAVFVWRESN